MRSTRAASSPTTTCCTPFARTCAVASERSTPRFAITDERWRSRPSSRSAGSSENDWPSCAPTSAMHVRLTPDQAFLNGEIDLVALAGGEGADDDALYPGLCVGGDEQARCREEQWIEQDAGRVVGADRSDESRSPVLNRPQFDRIQPEVLNVQHHRLGRVSC